MRINVSENFLEIQWLGLCTLVASGTQFQSLVGRLRSRKQHGKAKNKQTKTCWWNIVAHSCIRIEHNLKFPRLPGTAFGNWQGRTLSVKHFDLNISRQFSKYLLAYFPSCYRLKTVLFLHIIIQLKLYYVYIKIGGIILYMGFPCGSAGKESTCNAGDLGSVPGLGRSPGEKERLSTPVLWPGEFYGLYSPCGRKVGHDWAISHTLYGIILLQFI